MGAMDSIDRKIRTDKVIQSDVKLTKAGEKCAKANLKEVRKLLSIPNKLNLNQLMGIAVNPNIDTEIIRKIYNILHVLSKNEKQDPNISKATKTRNLGLRGKIRRLLAQNGNLNDDLIEKLIKSAGSNSDYVLGNPSIKEKHLQLYFDEIVNGAINNSYSFLSFSKLVKAKNITQKLMKRWYKELEGWSDWTYEDNNWYSIVEDYLNYDDIWEELLITIAGAPLSSKPISEWHRRGAVDHPKATQKVFIAAYKATKEEKYLPQTVQDVFLF